MTDIISNVSAVASSIALVREGHAKIELGIAGLASALCESWETPMRAVVNAGKANEKVYFFSFSDMGERRLKDDGETEETRFMAAAYLSVAENFGTGELSTKDKQAFKRALRVAGAKMHLGMDVSFTPAGAAFPIASVLELVKSETVRHEIPNEETGEVDVVLEEINEPTPLATLLAEKLKQAANAVNEEQIDDEQAMEKLLARKVVVNGKPDVLTGAETPALSEFASTFAAPLTAIGKDTFKSRAPRSEADKGAQFAANVQSVVDALAALLSAGAEGESDFAPTYALHVKMVKLADVVEEYLNSPVAAEVIAEELGKPVEPVQPELLPEQPEVPASGKRPSQTKVSNLD